MNKSILTIGWFSFQLYAIRYLENEDLFLEPAKLKLWFTFIINISILQLAVIGSWWHLSITYIWFLIAI